jgi:DNA-binding XRE family transcriptional regulator
MLARTKTHHTDKGLVSLTLKVPKNLAATIREYAENLIKQTTVESIPWRESFNRLLPNDSIAAVCLQSARASKGLTQKQLADLSDIPQRHISEMEHSKRNIGKERAIRLANVLDTDYRLFL